MFKKRKFKKTSATREYRVGGKSCTFTVWFLETFVGGSCWVDVNPFTYPKTNKTDCRCIKKELHIKMNKEELL